MQLQKVKHKNEIEMLTEFLAARLDKYKQPKSRRCKMPGAIRGGVRSHETPLQQEVCRKPGHRRANSPAMNYEISYFFTAVVRTRIFRVCSLV